MLLDACDESIIVLRRRKDLQERRRFGRYSKKEESDWQVNIVCATKSQSVKSVKYESVKLSSLPVLVGYFIFQPSEDER